MCSYLASQLLDKSPLQFTGREEGFEVALDAMVAGQLGSKPDSRHLLVCAAAPGHGKSAFLDELLKQSSPLRSTGPFVPLSATFNLHTNLCYFEIYDNVKVDETYKILLCRLAFRFVLGIPTHAHNRCLLPDI